MFSGTLALNYIHNNIPNYVYILKGLFITIGVSVGCFACGMIFGVILGFIIYLSHLYSYNFPDTHHYHWYKGFFIFFKFIQRFFINTPIISQVFIAYFVLSLSDNLVLISIGVLGLNSAAHTSVIVLEYLNNVSKVQWETAYSLGFTPFRAFYRIFLNEMLYNCQQNFFGELVTLVKESAMLSFFGVKDVCFRSKEIGLRFYNFTPYILFASLVYFLLIWIMEFIYGRYLANR